MRDLPGAQRGLEVAIADLRLAREEWLKDELLDEKE
jgi:hypothetical protein